MPEGGEAGRLALEYSPEAVRVLARLMGSTDEKVALAAAREMLLRGCGRPEAPAPAGEGASVVLVCEQNVQPGGES